MYSSAVILPLNPHQERTHVRRDRGTPPRPPERKVWTSLTVRRMTPAVGSAEQRGVTRGAGTRVRYARTRRNREGPPLPRNATSGAPESQRSASSWGSSTRSRPSAPTIPNPPSRPPRYPRTPYCVGPRLTEAVPTRNYLRSCRLSLSDITCPSIPPSSRSSRKVRTEPYLRYHSHAPPRRLLTGFNESEFLLCGDDRDGLSHLNDGRSGLTPEHPLRPYPTSPLTLPFPPVQS